jgi:hypothetical protein
MRVEEVRVPPWGTGLSPSLTRYRYITAVTVFVLVLGARGSPRTIGAVIGEMALQRLAAVPKLVTSSCQEGDPYARGAIDPAGGHCS